MKKILTTILALTIMASTYAMGFNGNVKAGYAFTSNGTGIRDFNFTPLTTRPLSFEVGTDLNFDFNNIGNVNVALDLIGAESMLNVKSAVSYNYVLSDNITVKAESTVDYFNNFDNTNRLYLDLTASLNYGVNVTDWLKINTEAGIGYVFVDSLNIKDNHADDNNSMVTKITVSANIKDIVIVYAGMESTEIWDDFGFLPLTVKNTLGLKLQYTFGNVTPFINLDYYCKHPELAWNYNVPVINHSSFNATVGFKYNL